MKLTRDNLLTSGHTFGKSQRLLRYRYKYLNYILIVSFALQPLAAFALYIVEGWLLTLVELASFLLTVVAFFLLRQSKHFYNLAVWLYVASPIAITYLSLFLTDNNGSRTVLPLYSIIVVFFFLGSRAGWLMILLGYIGIVATLSYDSGLTYESWIATALLMLIVGFIFTFYDQMYRVSLQQMQKFNEKLHTIAMTDTLTQIYSRLGLEETLQKQMKAYKKTGEYFVILMIDIDHFKMVNDTHGHHAGDEVLKTIATIIASNLRLTDTLGRWGGEEFLAILPNTTLEEAYHIASNICHKVYAHNFEGIGQKSVSIGADTVHLKDDSESLIQRVDAYLYEAKNSGRNRVCSALAATAVN